MGKARPDIEATTLERLFADSEQLWAEFQARRGPAFHAFVPSDYAAGYEVLRDLRSHADSFLELGSGVGTVAIMASLLGFDAAGIEIEDGLVESATTLAEEFAARVQFASGTFVPETWQEAFDLADTEVPAVFEGPSGYAELGRDLDDFDLIHAFYWPGLEELFFALVADCARQGALLLTYHGTDGYQVWRDGQRFEPPKTR